MKVPTLLLQLIEKGVEPVIRKDKDGALYFDLQSGMKSQLHFYPDSTGGFTHTIKMRYDEEKLVEDVYDVLWVARKAMHGRDYASCIWHEILSNS